MTATSYFLVEWYGPELLDRPLDEAVAILDGAASRGTDPVRLMMAVSAPADEVIYGVFAAESGAAVRRVCLSAGCPPDRMVNDIDARVVGAPC
ncbi:hypothetical protein H7I02_11385 [Mycolicibacterium brumae]|uniref:DUF4242 domain-containing protein n=2 Tax=Mycolicibacterium brumae TaxID=85968 RepID=A0A2G5P8W3_9MYCO|nr:hypothetical protein [Mycolicibacterium brumae]MCV7193393.1 hypothetical protein [Mycolicibacterium brumae]PIB74799.1 hypothetical protein CQY22_011805 [Mycolicibacterium brumae]RWA22259.1 hypothetical protein MBRU_13280 [Mycolicibacterium brumae DSM 44177]UWW07238.1 hypothetical protein L2Z93_000236 [Mycolicibacterium brumae]